MLQLSQNENPSNPKLNEQYIKLSFPYTVLKRDNDIYGSPTIIPQEYIYVADITSGETGQKTGRKWKWK